MESPKATKPAGKDRNRLACGRCNAKKIKCNAAPGVSCQGCISSQTPCVLLNSRRGRYPRRKKRAAQATPAQDGSFESINDPVSSSSAFNSARSRESQNNTIDIASVHRPIESNGSHGANTEAGDDGTQLSSLSRAFEARAPTDSSAMFYLHITDQGVDPSRQSMGDAISTFYAGGSFSLTYVINDVLAPLLSDKANHKKRLHFPVAQGFDPSDTGRENIVLAQVRLLRERNVYHALSTAALKKMLDGYFRWFHPAYPLLNKRGFLEKCLNNQMSLLVLNAVLMVAVPMCDTVDLLSFGFISRLQARDVFYRQARTLYDADMDPDKVNIVTAAFLLGFWWAGSNDEKDSWHWLGIAVNLAQTLGMHRSTANSHMSLEKSRLWRRTWWCLQMRDAMASGSLGRPPHCCEWDVDVEMLQHSDLVDLDCQLESDEAHYACQMAYLSTIFRRIVVSRYAARPSSSMEQKMTLETSLDNFRKGIPDSLEYNGADSQDGRGIWAAMLLMAYNFGVILLCRPPNSASNEDGLPLWGNRTKAMAAANEVTRVMEDLLASSAVRLCQLHTVPALFNSLSMHVLSLCTSGVVGRELAENRARICMLGLTCLQDSWPVSGWILKLFVDIMDRLRKKYAANGTSQARSDANEGMFAQLQQQGRHDSGESSTHESTKATLTPTRGTWPSYNVQTDDSVTTLSDPQNPMTAMTANWFDSAANSQTPGNMFPNLFVLDDLLPDSSLAQANFFEFLTFPDYTGLE